MKKISKILLPVDFSEQGAGAAAYAGWLARHFGASVTILHVNPLFLPGLALPREFAGPIDTGWVTSIEAQRRKELESYQYAEFQGVDVSRVVVTGDPSGKILERARQEQVDLIVMPTHGFGPFRRFLLGSVVAKVLDEADCPVWTGSHLEETSRRADIAQVLCAIDNSPTSEHVVRWAWEFAQEFKAPLSVVHALGRLESPDDFLAEGELGQREEKTKTTIECFLKKAGAEADILITAGDPAKVVADAAKRVQADVAVIGRSPKKSELGRLRPQAYSIIREAPCAVVSV
jgi:nucleotide-binding universal stress UspA family protein